jgi:hypothetical protein
MSSPRTPFCSLDGSPDAPSWPCLAGLVLGLNALLPGCGRIGIELLPMATDTEASTTGDAGSVGPAPCESGCSNAHGSAECVNARCVLQCAAGYADCDGNADNGCEANVASDPAHCGACQRACDVNAQVCSSGVCESSPCSPGRGECVADAPISCETDLTSSSQHCGFCGNTCVAEHATPACLDRSCVISGCDTGYADCDARSDNGCEAALDSAASCGSCGVSCSNAHGLASCTSARCTPSCAASYADCDGNPNNGCETALDSAQNCGMCGRSCTATGGGTAVCSAGSCGTRCDLNGVYALRLSAASSWPATTYLSAGNGDFVWWGLLRLTQNGTELAGTLNVCGETVPDFRAMPLINERYGVIVPTAVFDASPGLASIPATGTLAGTAPGARLTLARSAFLIGASMADPINGAWPSANAIMALDPDGDGKSALSVPYKSGSGYALPPADTLGSTRGQTAYLATRIAFSLSGALDTCSSSAGSVSAVSVDAHTLGCRVQGNARDCTTAEANHLDDNTPRFQVGTASYVLQKLSDSATCSMVRSALP